MHGDLNMGAFGGRTLAPGTRPGDGFGRWSVSLPGNFLKLKGPQAHFYTYKVKLAS